VDKNPPAQRFVFGSEHLRLNELGLRFLQENWPGTLEVTQDLFTCPGTDQPALRILQSHGDQVIQLPSNAVLLASSDTTENEIFRIGENIIAMQGHPEMSVKDLVDKILPALRNGNRLSAEEEERALASLQIPLSSTKFLQVLRHWFRREVENPT